MNGSDAGQGRVAAAERREDDCAGSPGDALLLRTGRAGGVLPADAAAAISSVPPVPDPVPVSPGGGPLLPGSATRP